MTPSQLEPWQDPFPLARPAANSIPPPHCQNAGRRMKSKRRSRVKSKKNTRRKNMKRWRSKRHPMQRRRKSNRKRRKQRGGMIGGNPITYAGEYLSNAMAGKAPPPGYLPTTQPGILQ